MADRFETLKKACGGVLNPETLTDFQRAMREYEVFMDGMRELFAPVGEDAENMAAEMADKLERRKINR